MEQTDIIIEMLTQLRADLKLQKDILTFEEFCKYVGISKSAGYKLTSTKRIPYYRPNGKMVYIERKDADKWMRTNKIDAK